MTTGICDLLCRFLVKIWYLGENEWMDLKLQNIIVSLKISFKCIILGTFLYISKIVSSKFRIVNVKFNIIFPETKLAICRTDHIFLHYYLESVVDIYDI